MFLFSLDVLWVFKANTSVKCSVVNRLGKGGGQAELTWSQRTARETDKFLLCFDFFPLPLSGLFNLLLPARAATSPQLWWLPISMMCLRQLCSSPKGLSQSLVAGGLP